MAYFKAAVQYITPMMGGIVSLSCSSTKMTLALNKLKRVDMPLNKETKPKLNVIV